MRAMVLSKLKSQLELKEVPLPALSPGKVLIQVSACGVCRTDLHIVDGELPCPALPLIPGHEIVGKIIAIGEQVTGFKIGDRVGVPWLGSTCGSCEYCMRGMENLCETPGFTGYTLPGGYAEYIAADARYVFHISGSFDDYHAAPFLCAGLIGYRSYRMLERGVDTIGLYGFGAAAHILTQICLSQGKKVYAFTRPGDLTGQNFARSVGAIWAGDSDQAPPQLLDAAIIFAPLGDLLPLSLRAVKKGGQVVCGGIHMSDIPSFSYSLLWGERSIKSVANLTRKDGEDFFKAISAISLQTHVVLFPLHQANEALHYLRKGLIHGAAVLSVR